MLIWINFADSIHKEKKFMWLNISGPKNQPQKQQHDSRFLAEMIKIILKNLKLLLPLILQRIYFCFNLVAKFW